MCTTMKLQVVDMSQELSSWTWNLVPWTVFVLVNSVTFSDLITLSSDKSGAGNN